MNTEQDNFPKILKRLRTDKGLTLRQLADEVDSNFAYLSQLEAGLAKPSEELVRRIAKYFVQDEEKLVFLARDIPGQIREIKEKFPNVAPNYFRRAARKDKK